MSSVPRTNSHLHTPPSINSPDNDKKPVIVSPNDVLSSPASVLVEAG